MQRFKIRFTLKGQPMEEKLEGANPISALDHFHKSMQLTSVIKPGEYKILSLHHIYPKDPWGTTKLGMIESRFDIPKTANPNLAYAPRRPALTEEMPFVEDLSEGKLSE